jgi:secondary thiamine-phosphate synthase enzyme
MKTFLKTLEIDTDQNNLLTLEPKLIKHVEDMDFFHIVDFTEQAHQWVKESGIQNGILTLQALHTTCVVAMNELDEPCLLGDINKMLRDSVPRTKPYLHNSSIRTKNLCEEDTKCDRNADAHIKASLFGAPTQSVIVTEGKPLFGTWQRLCMIDMDGPRKRKLAVQIIGE